MHERRRLVALAFAHAPAPDELQLLDVAGRDLRQRTVAPALIVAARHQPVAWILIAQHLVGDRHVVLHGARYGEAQRPGICRGAPRPPPAPCASRRLSRASSCGGSAATSGRRRGCGCSGRRRAGGDRANRHGSVGGERRLARGRAVRLQDVRGDREILCRAQVLSGRRHRRLDELEQILRRPVTPRAHEVVAGQLRRLVAAGEVRHVAARAARGVDGRAARSLAGVEDRRWRRLTRPLTGSGPAINVIASGAAARHAASDCSERFIGGSPAASANPTSCRRGPSRCEAARTAVPFRDRRSGSR